MPRSFQLTCLVLFLSTWCFSQTGPANPLKVKSETSAGSPATVSFTIDFPSSQPEHYSIRIPAEGPAHYESGGHLSADSDQTDSFELEFPLTAETRQKVFALAARAGYFHGDIDSRHKGLAFTGKKTLSYQGGGRSGEATYNYSPNPAVQELTALMQGLSATLECGHRLQYDFRYQKLALDEELRHMEMLARDSQLSEVAAIASILEQIIADQSVMNVTRARAKRLLDSAGGH